MTHGLPEWPSRTEQKTLDVFGWFAAECSLELKGRGLGLAFLIDFGGFTALPIFLFLLGEDLAVAHPQS